MSNQKPTPKMPGGKRKIDFKMLGRVIKMSLLLYSDRKSLPFPLFLHSSFLHS